jgi:hypothetical protein
MSTLPELYLFLNSNFFIALITLIVGLGAYAVYMLQKRDSKREAANIILLEIRAAERKLVEIKKSLRSESLPNDLRLMPTENWSKFSYLFIRDFDRDEWDSIVNFYNNCHLIDETVKYNNDSFWNDVEQIRSNKQRLLADYAYHAAQKLKSEEGTPSNKNTAVLENFDEISNKVDELYMSKQAKFGYTPQKTLNDAKKYVDDIAPRISQSSIGLKLKKMARIKAGF